jgi:hypothetical protein
VSFSIATLDDDILTFGPAQVPQPLKERVKEPGTNPGASSDVQNADPGFLARLLRLGRERRRKKSHRAGEERTTADHSVFQQTPCKS